MFNKTLIILDISENITLERSNFDLINLGNGYVKSKNKFKKVELYDLLGSNFKYYRKELGKSLGSKLKKTLEKNSIDFNFLEISNMRNDKSNIFEKIITLAIIKNELNIKKYKEIIIYFDNKDYEKIYLGLFRNKTKIIFYNVNKINIKIPKYIYYMKYQLKLLIISSLCKIITPKKIINQKDTLNICLDPKLIFRKKKAANELNFILTDDTHFTDTLYNNIKKVFINNEKKLLNIEYFVNIREIFLKFVEFVCVNKNVGRKFENFYFKNIQIGSLLNEYFQISLLNYFKISNFQNAIKNAYKYLKPKIINYYLFEYNFGFFVKKNFYDLNKKILFNGYQHGIFGENLFWFDIIKDNKSKKKYLPNKIHLKYNVSDKGYRQNFKKKEIKKNVYEKKSSFTNLKIHKSSKNNLIILGLHDYKDTIKVINNYLNFTNQKSIFICKVHPKMRLNLINLKLNKRIKIIKKINNVKFSKIFISKYSTIAYEFIAKKKPFYIINKNIYDYNSQSILKKKMVYLK